MAEPRVRDLDEASLPHQSGAEERDPPPGFDGPDEIVEFLLPPEEFSGRLLRIQVEEDGCLLNPHERITPLSNEAFWFLRPRHR